MTIFQKIVKAGDLPPEWAKAFPDPNADVQVVVREVDKELASARSIDEIMDLISDRAAKRGLTPEMLRDILNER